MATSIIPTHFQSCARVQDNQRVIVAFKNGEIQLEHSIADRIEFLNARCNLTLKNSTTKKHGVNVVVRVLNKTLIEIWSQSEKWLVQSLMPGQIHTISWAFSPSVPDVVWNERARLTVPEWVMVDVL